MPLACVDFVLVRDASDGVEIGLILRDSPFGRVWCHLGGRIGRGETIREALLRHADDTLGVTLDLAADPQPDHVYQWFPPDGRPADADMVAYGEDPRKHAIGLSFLVRAQGDPEPRNEGLDFAWFPPARLPDPLWPGCRSLLDRLLAGARG